MAPTHIVDLITQELSLINEPTVTDEVKKIRIVDMTKEQVEQHLDHMLQLQAGKHKIFLLPVPQRLFNVSDVDVILKQIQNEPNIHMGQMALFEHLFNNPINLNILIQHVSKKLNKD